jgi:hypothetical protein
MYYVRFADLLTDADLCEMSVPFSIDRRIVQPGAFSCDIDVTNSVIGNVVQKIVPQRTIAHVYRDSLILGSYIVWTKTLSGSNGKIQCSLQGSTLESYLYYRRIVSDLSYTATDQITIATDLVGVAQTWPAPYAANANLGISTVSSASGVLRDRTYPASDGKFVGDVLEELANVDDGFEYVIHTIQGSSTRDRTMLFGYPQLSPSSNPFVIEEPGSISSWKIVYDGTQGWNIFWTRGSVSDENGTGPILSSAYIASEYLENGFPVLEHVTDYSNVSDSTTLDKYAVWWARNRGGPLFTPSFTVDANRIFDGGFSPMLLGSSFMYILSNPAFPMASGVPTMSGINRMIGFEVRVDSSERTDMNILIETTFDPTDVT